MAGYWIKLYHEVLDDPKMATLPDNLWRRFYELCLIAGRTDQEGNLPETKQIAWTLRMQVEDLQKDIDDLVKLGLVSPIRSGWNVTNFAKRQSKLEPAEKMKRYREEQKRDKYYQEPVTEPVTDSLLSVTQKERKKDIKKEEIEIDIPSPFSKDDEKNWQRAKGELLRGMDKVDWDTWVRDLQLARVSDGKFVIQAINKTGKDWVQARCASTLERALMSKVEITV